MNPPTLPVRIGAVLFPGFELLDVFGPLEMFGALQERVSITMLGECAGEIASSQGPKAVVELALAETDGFDILLIPGGKGTRAGVNDLPFLQSIHKNAESSKIVATVCTGSALLAKTGLLDGKRATSNKIAFSWVCSQGPSVSWVRKARWVKDGKFITSSGVSAGMDMSLALIQEIFGREVAVETARYAEYLWNEDLDSDPFA